MTGTEPPRASTRGPILLLAAQGFALGLTSAWILIPASAIFLVAYGSEMLPVTYIGAALAGVVSSIALAAAFRRRSLASVATMTLAGLAVALAASWLVLALDDAEWVSFALLVLVPIVVPVGFIFVVGQAGLLLDVRVLKAFYARVVAGFALGFVVGGLAGPVLLSVLGTTESVLAAAAVATVLFLALVDATRRRYPAQLSVLAPADDAGDTLEPSERPTLRALTRNRYVMLIVAFQMLSAVESQWLDFHVLATASQRYESSTALATFLSRFSAIAYGTDILFLVLLAGWLLHHFGLRYGLTANAIGVLSLVVAVIVATAVMGSGATLVFALIVAARVADLTFSDGTSRTSLSAAYQAVPHRTRAVAQAAVEGLAVPVAIGLSGVMLLVVQSVGGERGLMLPLLTSTVVMAWLVVAILLYREYRVNLLANLRGRTLHAGDLAVEEESSLLAIDRLIGSDDERDVRLGLDILTRTRDPDLATRLRRLTADSRPGVRTEALRRLAAIDPADAAITARTLLDDPSSDVRAASIRCLGVAGIPDELAAVTGFTDDPAPEVRVAVAFALSRSGDADALARVATDVERLRRAERPTDRIMAARMLGAVDPAGGVDRIGLRTLLEDPDPEVVNAALDALRWPQDADLVPAIPAHLEHRPTAGAALDALVRIGDAALDVVDEGLRGNRHSRTVQELLVRATREIGGPRAVAVLRGHFEHLDREVGLAVMRALAALGPEPTSPGTGTAPAGGAGDDLTESVVRDDLEHATHALRALVAFEDEPAATLLVAALGDELELIRERVLAAFSMRHGTEGFHRVAFQLAQRDARSHALALEWLDVTLAGTDRAAIALLEPRLSVRERLGALSRTFPLPQLGRHDVLLELVQDRDGRWRRPWVTACAIYAAAEISAAELDAITDAAAATDHTSGFGFDEDRIVHETLAGIHHRRLDPV